MIVIKHALMIFFLLVGLAEISLGLYLMFTPTHELTIQWQRGSGQ